MSRSILVLVVLSLICAGCSSGIGENQAGKPGQKSKEVVRLKEHKSGEWTPDLSDEEKGVLFSIVNDTLVWCTSGSKGDFFKQHTYSLSAKLKTDYATFVTLKISGMLRGCIGSLQPCEPLYMSVHNNAVSAAMRDRRFKQVKPAELEVIDVHISILSPIAGIGSLDEFKIGEHGIIIEKGFYRAVYLPEVAVEQNWNREQTLSSLSQKAGMSADGWKQGASFKVFSSVVLSEDEGKE